MTEPNRAARRHPIAAPQPPAQTVELDEDEAPPILRIFGGGGDEVTLGGGDIYHCAKLTAAGVANIQRYLTNGIPAVEGDTLGEQLVGGVLATSNWPALNGLLKLMIEEPVPLHISEVSSPDELVDTIDTFFRQSGLKWLEKLVKNLTSRAAKAMEERMALLVDEAMKNVPNPPVSIAPAGTAPSLQPSTSSS